MKPEGWEMPQDATPGQPFQAVGTFMMDEGGNITLMEIDGAPIEGYEEPEMEDEAQIQIEIGGEKKKKQRPDSQRFIFCHTINNPSGFVARTFVYYISAHHSRKHEILPVREQWRTSGI